MTTNRFFRLVWRLNALVIAAVSVLGLILGGYGLVQVASHETRPLRATSIARSDPAVPQKLAIGAFSWLESNRLLWAPLEASTDYRLGLHSKSASSIRNYVVYDVTNSQARHILPDTKGLIASAIVLRSQTSAPADPLTPAKAIVLAHIEADANGDGLLTRTDAATVMIAAGDGSDAKPLELEPGRLIDARLVSDTEALVMIARVAGVEAVHIALATRTIIKRQLIPAALK